MNTIRFWQPLAQMKRFCQSQQSCRHFIAFLSILILTPAPAATIDWGSPTTISGDSDVVTTGALVAAFHDGGTVVPSVTVNGVTFSPFESNQTSTSVTNGNFTLSGSTDIEGAGGFTSSSGPFANLSTDYKTLLQSTNYLNNTKSPLTLTMGGLTIGQQYQFQLWVNDPSFVSGSPRSETLTAGNSVTLQFNTSASEGGLGQFVIGTFTADSTSEVITIVGSSTAVGAPYPAPQINAFQLRTAAAFMPTATVTFYHQSGGGVNPEGHAFVSLTKKTGATIVDGFYCKDYQYLIDIPEIGFSGAIVQDAFTPWDYKITYSISDAQYNAALAVIAHDTQSPPNYTLISFNCMNWVLRVAIAAGVQLPQSNYPLLPIVDPYQFGISLQAIGNGNSFMGGVVAANPTPLADLPPLPSGALTPFDYSYTGLESAGHSDPAALAAAIGIGYEHINLGTVMANNINGLSLNLAQTDAGRSLISIDWGDGSALQQQSLTFSHIYGSGNYTAHLLVIDAGAVHFYDMTVVVSPATAAAVNVQITSVPPVSIPNQGLVPATLGPDFLVMQALSVSISPNGHAVASFLGIPTLTYTIDATSDLTQGFSPVGSATADTNGNFQYDDPAAIGATSRFYRATYP